MKLNFILCSSFKVFTKLLKIHSLVIKHFGGTDGVLYSGTIDHLVYKINRKNNVFDKASLILFYIITGHPFHDGNKRTAFQLADLLLRDEKYHIHSNNEKTVQFLLSIAEYKCCFEKINLWLRKNTRFQPHETQQLQLQ